MSSSPAAGSTIDAPPSEVTLTFNDVILDLAAAGGGGGDASTGSAPASGGSSVVQVTGPDGQGTHFETGCATDSGRTVSVPVALGGSGQYTVTWRVVSADGHPVSDSIAFTYQAPAGAWYVNAIESETGCPSAETTRHVTVYCPDPPSATGTETVRPESVAQPVSKCVPCPSGPVTCTTDEPPEAGADPVDASPPPPPAAARSRITSLNVSVTSDGGASIVEPAAGELDTR